MPVAASDLQGLLGNSLARKKIDLPIVGPDDALAAGIVDLFQQNGLRIFGPTRAAAQFESSKIFAKEFMQRHGIPTAASGHFSDSAEAHRFCQKMKYPVVTKADGLALGKGVIIAKSAGGSRENDPSHHGPETTRRCLAQHRDRGILPRPEECS